MRNPRDMTPQERLARIGEILYKGICLVEMEKRSCRRNAPDQDGAIKTEYTVSEAAKEIKVSQRTIQRWIKKGRLVPVRKLNGDVFLPAEKINHLSDLVSLRLK